MYAKPGLRLLYMTVLAVGCTAVVRAQPPASEPDDGPPPPSDPGEETVQPLSPYELPATGEPDAEDAGAGAETDQETPAVQPEPIPANAGPGPVSEGGVAVEPSYDEEFGMDLDTSQELSDAELDEELLMGDNIGLELSGWLDAVFKHNTKDDAKPFFDVNHIYVIADARVGEIWRAFFETEYEHLPKVEPPEFEADEESVEGGKGEIKIERAYIEGGFHRGFSARLGKFNTPMGLRIPAHWLILTPIVQKPIHEDNKYVPLKGVGLNVFGWLPLGEQELGYSAYVTNGTELFGTDGPTDGITGAGGDLNIRLWEWVLIGGSYYHQKNPSQDDRTEHSATGYGELQIPIINVLLRGEYFYQHRNRAADDLTTVRVVYGLVRYQFHPWEPLSLAYRFDWGDDERRAGGERHMAHNLNISVQPEPFLRFSLEGNIHVFPESADTNYKSLTFWAGMAF